MEQIEIYSSTKEMLRVAVESNRDNVLTGTPEFGFTDDEGTEPTSWDTGSWFSDAQTVERVNDRYVRSYVAQILVGGVGTGATVELAEGEHFVWTKVTMPDSQAPVKLAGKVTVL